MGAETSTFRNPVGSTKNTYTRDPRLPPPVVSVTANALESGDHANSPLKPGRLVVNVFSALLTVKSIRQPSGVVGSSITVLTRTTLWPSGEDTRRGCFIAPSSVTAFCE